MNLLRQCSPFVVHAIELQLFLFCFSLPLLLWWGLPFSLLSIIGNLFFTPFLLLFLLLSSLIFLCGLCNLSPTLLCSILEKFTTLWLYLLSIPTASFLLYGKALPLSVLLLIPSAALYIIARKRHFSQALRILLLTVILVLTFLISHVAARVRAAEIVPLSYGKSFHYFIYTPEKTALVLNPTPFSTQDFNSWVEYCLCTQLAQKYGSIKIDYLIILKSIASTVGLARVISAKCHPTHIYLPYWPAESDSTKKIAKAYGALLRTLGTYKGTLKRLHQPSLTLPLCAAASLTVAQEKNLAAHTAYTALCTLNGTSKRLHPALFS